MDIRQKAEQLLQAKHNQIETVADEDLSSLIHELRVHQVELELQNEELRQTQRELEKAQSKYFDLYHFAPIGYFTFDKNGLIIELNLAGADLLGLERERLLNKPFISYLNSEFHQAFYLHRLRTLESDTVQNCELTLHKRDGTQIYVQIKSVAMSPEPGEPKYLHSAITDLTERKAAESKLNEQARFIESIAESSPNILYVDHVAEQRNLYINQAMQNILGYTVAEVQAMGRNFLPNLTHSDDLSQFAEVAQQLNSKPGQVIESKFRMRDKQGQWHWFLARNLVFERAPDGRIAKILGTMQDVTAQQRIQDALAESEKRYRLVTELISDYVYACRIFPDGQVDSIWVTDAFYRIYGLSNESIEKQGWLHFVHPDYRHIVSDNIQKILHQQAYDCEYCVITFDGTVRWLRDSGKPVHWQGADHPVLVYGAVQDITERKRAEELLRSNYQFLETLINTIPSPIFYKDKLGRYLGCNDIFAQKILGSSSKQIIGRSLYDFPSVSYDLADAYHARDLELLARSGVQIYEQQVYHFDGTPHEYLFYKATFEDSHTAVAGIVGVMLDITERKHMEDVLRTNETRYRQLAELNQRLLGQAQQDAATKAELLREVNHRVKNNLSAIIGLLYAEQRYAETEQLSIHHMIMKELIGRVRGLATVHNLLSASQWQPLLLSELTRQISLSAIQALPPGQHISIKVQDSPLRLTADQAHNLALVINELTTNTVKHALSAAGQTAEILKTSEVQITVRISCRDNLVNFEFRDNGVGYPEAILQAQHHQMAYCNVGFDLIQNIVRRALRGQLLLSNDHGAVTVIKFKLEMKSHEYEVQSTEYDMCI